MAEAQFASAPYGSQAILGSSAGSTSAAASSSSSLAGGAAPLLMGASAVGSLITGFYQADQERLLARAQAAAIKVDETATMIQARRKRAVLRNQRASAAGSIRVAAAASGVVSTSGSVLAALAANAAAGAQEEYDVIIEKQSRLNALQDERRYILRGGKARATARRMQGVGSLTTGVGEIVAMAQPGA